MRPHLRCLVVFLAAALAVGVRAADDLKAMSGTWKPTRGELGGVLMPPPVLKSITLKIVGANYEVTVETDRGTAVDKGTVAIDSTTRPKSITITGVEGPTAGKTFPCIYEFAGDTLRICYDLSCEKRPTEFKTVAGTKLYLATYERVK